MKDAACSSFLVNSLKVRKKSENLTPFFTGHYGEDDLG
jgi:hypothetical protein